MLRVGVGSSLAVREVIPKLAPFLNRHPALRLDLMLDERRQDLVIEGIDVAFRFGPLSDPAIVARHIRGWPRVLTAFPAYLADAGVPQNAADLSAHDIIIGPVSATTNWSFRREGGTSISVRVEGA